MVSRFKRKFADINPGSESPLSYALGEQDKSTLAMVQDAIEHRQTLLAYQPVVRATAQDQIGFYEGLIRVLDPTGRVIPAKDFMPVVEDTNTGRQIDVLALNMGLGALHANPNLRLSLNMSARSIGFKAWNGTLNKWLSKNPTIGERLILEISESSAMTVPELVADFMDRLQPKGICFALDNFGSGFTAIRYFKDLLFDVMKIDGQFIRGISQNPDNRALTAAMLSIADHFDMLTVAEYVENAEDAAVLTELGVDCLQGYYFSAPTTQPEWLRDANIRRAM